MSELSFKNGVTYGLVLSAAELLRYDSASRLADVKRSFSAAGISPTEDLTFCSEFDLETIRQYVPGFENVPKGDD